MTPHRWWFSLYSTPLHGDQSGSMEFPWPQPGVHTGTSIRSTPSTLSIQLIGVQGPPESARFRVLGFGFGLGFRGCRVMGLGFRV